MPNEFANARRRRILEVTVPYDAATVDRSVYIARGPVRVRRITHVHTVAGTGSITINKCTGTQSPAAGTALCGDADMAAVANTVTNKPLVSTGAILLNAGDRLAIDVTSLVTVAGGVIVFTLETF